MQFLNPAPPKAPEPKVAKQAVSKTAGTEQENGNGVVVDLDEEVEKPASNTLFGFFAPKKAAVAPPAAAVAAASTPAAQVKEAEEAADNDEGEEEEVSPLGVPVHIFSSPKLDQTKSM